MRHTAVIGTYLISIVFSSNSGAYSNQVNPVPCEVQGKAPLADGALAEHV